MVIKGILGQVAAAAATDTDLYAVPDGKSATVKVVAVNKSSDTDIRIWVAVDGVATEGKQYLVYDKLIELEQSLVTSTFIMGGEDVLRVRAVSADVSFTCSGIEE